MNRRGFLAGILAAGVAPYVMADGVASRILMPVRRTVIVRPNGVVRLYGLDGSLVAKLDHQDLTKPIVFPALGTCDIARVDYYSTVDILGGSRKFSPVRLVNGDTLTLTL